ncbi:hypothetical protein IT413_01110, partial [Candidatus Peregrinibacteria bacterium]|nr:hypothetical protein [Candidatus Peregrinibacteria bacterium]
MLEGNHQFGGTAPSLEAAQFARSEILRGKYDPDATKVNKVSAGIGKDIKRTFEQMCIDHNKSTSQYMDQHIRSTAPAPIKKVTIQGQRAGEAQIDQSTLEVFGGYNLDSSTMTAADEKKLRSHFLLADDERGLKRHELVSLLKVKMLDEAARLKDINGARPVDYSHPNPSSYNVNSNENTAQRLERQSGVPQFVQQPG